MDVSLLSKRNSARYKMLARYAPKESCLAHNTYANNKLLYLQFAHHLSQTLLLSYLTACEVKTIPNTITSRAPLWPNGYGIGLLSQGLWVRVPSGVMIFFLYAYTFCNNTIYHQALCLPLD